jgi:hypothetical protein
MDSATMGNLVIAQPRIEEYFLILTEISPHGTL